VFVRSRSYSYLLGMYLGDGWVGPAHAGAQLVVRLDARYAAIIDECVAAATAVLPGRRVAV
jgi:hypothetical protein